MAGRGWRHGAAPCAVAMLARATAAHAAGGADVVDDTYVESPSVCHIESWLTTAFSAAFSGAALEHVGLGCTPGSVPRLELDLAGEHADGGGWAIQPGLKYSLRARPGAFAAALSAAARIDARGRAVGIAMVMPVSIVRGRYTIVNLDIGAQSVRGRHGLGTPDATWGAQIAQAVAPHVGLIGELFGIGGRAPGAQGGLRWSPGPQKVDIDLRAAREVGGRATVTLGLTVRL